MIAEAKNPSGSTVSLQTDYNNSLKVIKTASDVQSRVLSGNVFFCASQAARTTSVALNTTYTGLVVSNPPNSGKNLIILKATWALSVAPVAIATIGLFTGYSSTEVTHTTPENIYNSLYGKGNVTVAKADNSATLPVAPVWNRMFMGGFTAGALPSTGPAEINLNGDLVIPPGGYVGIGTLTATVGFGSIQWEETTI